MKPTSTSEAEQKHLAHSYDQAARDLAERNRHLAQRTKELEALKQCAVDCIIIATLRDESSMPIPPHRPHWDDSPRAARPGDLRRHRAPSRIANAPAASLPPSDRPRNRRLAHRNALRPSRHRRISRGNGHHRRARRRTFADPRLLPRHQHSRKGGRRQRTLRQRPAAAGPSAARPT
jgi:hypothetical protein